RAVFVSPVWRAARSDHGPSGGIACLPDRMGCRDHLSCVVLAAVPISCKPTSGGDGSDPTIWNYQRFPGSRGTDQPQLRRSGYFGGRWALARQQAKGDEGMRSASRTGHVLLLTAFVNFAH